MSRGWLLRAGTIAALLLVCGGLADPLKLAGAATRDRIALFGTSPPPPPPAPSGPEVSPEAQLAEGLRHLHGDSVPQSTERAASLIRTAAERGNADAQYLIGVTNALRPPDDRDDAAAVEWLARAAVQGHARAQFALAEAYANGIGVPPEQEWANVWYERAAYQGHRDALFMMGMRTLVGEGGLMDRVAAYRWLAMASMAGHADAQRYRSAIGKRINRWQRANLDAEIKAWQPAEERSFPDMPLIRFVQLALALQGFDTGGIDGRMGQTTRVALRAFAKEERILGGGEITPEHVARLRQRLRNPDDSNPDDN
jgi:TPR repeat protein